MEDALREEVLQQQKAGLLTTTKWIQYRAKNLVPPPARFSASQGWCYAFMTRKGLSSNTNKMSILKWHVKLRRVLGRSGE